MTLQIHVSDIIFKFLQPLVLLVNFLNKIFLPFHIVLTEESPESHYQSIASPVLLVAAEENGGIEITN